MQGKQSECRKKVLKAMEVGQVLYDQQFVTYLRKTFLEDNNNQNQLNQSQMSANMSNSGGMGGPGNKMQSNTPTMKGPMKRRTYEGRHDDSSVQSRFMQ